jgi:hypothetical protein
MPRRRRTVLTPRINTPTLGSPVTRSAIEQEPRVFRGRRLDPEQRVDPLTTVTGAAGAGLPRIEGFAAGAGTSLQPKGFEEALAAFRGLRRVSPKIGRGGQVTRPGGFATGTPRDSGPIVSAAGRFRGQKLSSAGATLGNPSAFDSPTLLGG